MSTKKKRFQQQIAEKAYDVGFGAKKNLATYDIIEKAPGWISFISLAVGILSLIIEPLSGKIVSATLLILGITVLYIEPYRHEKQKYMDAGDRATQIFNSLKTLCRKVEDKDDDDDFQSEEQELNSLESEFYSTSVKKQIFLSDWYAHFKFFWQFQISWIEKHRKFKLFRDKIPLSLYATVAAIIIISIILFIFKKGC
ncbi:SLATT domain-containing protein [Vreelandella venusta]|uniref:SMODS and SLOG-associating 2TM effector domain-containing protein n=1 Tax=Vreelandella venusta TaxID=44935 RepID=A0ABX2BD31_9GAMM|nr:SLATT domain-containing protein [Halomonas venusta]AZM96092.1 SLATT domain-containing protein [Halomonas venusta]NPT30616.1 hypothetical protein [Halomonas venusta]